ncbi:hypothetical protein QE152_g40991 [Popillia japonica]|uniref:Retrotransposon gag domain-containing protein n=1 Tax=Popillia japonica TaxID=7064 RepID=A0AAW1HER5_POPJA
MLATTLSQLDRLNTISSPESPLLHDSTRNVPEFLPFLQSTQFPPPQRFQPVSKWQLKFRGDDTLSQLDRLNTISSPESPLLHDSTRNVPEFLPFLQSTQFPPPQRFQPVSKWQLKFRGDDKSMTVHSFLERVNELRVARGLTEAQLFDSAIDLFEGKALLWFRSNRDVFNDWKSLSALLIKHYEPPDYRARLFEDILGRTQDPA